MRVVITKKDRITSKKGENFTIFKGISESGDTVELFFQDTNTEDITVCDGVLADPASVQQLFKSEQPVDVQFNQRGRVDSVTVA